MIKSMLPLSYLQGLLKLRGRAGSLLGETKCQQHSAKLGHASPQFNLQVSSYPATQSSYQTSQSSIHFWSERQSKLSTPSVHTYCVPLLRYLNQPPAQTTVHQHSRRNPQQRPTKLTAYDSTTCSRRANSTQDPNTNHTHKPCVIPSRSSHYAQQQSPPSSSPTCNHSSPPYPYQSPTISHPLPSQTAFRLKSNKTPPPYRSLNNYNHTTTSSAARTKTPAHQATTTARISARQAFAVHPAQDAVLMQRDMSHVAHEEQLAQARLEQSRPVHQLVLALAVRPRPLRRPETLDCW